MTELHHIPAALILPLLLAVSCTKHSPEQDRSAIAFAPAPHTKSIVQAPVDMQPFAVWGYFTPEGNTASEEIFSCTKVYRPDDGFGNWTYDSPRYWTEDSYRFYAVHPFPDTTAVKAACTDGTGLTIDFSSPAADIDLMTAAATRTYSADDPASADAVPLDFGHLLARVSIVVSTQGGEITINSLTFSGMHLSGTCSYTPAAASAADQVQWTVDNGGQDGTGMFTLVSADEALSGEKTYADLLLIPGPDQDPSASTVNLEYTVGSGEAEKVSMNLPEAPLWECGKRYTYTITVKPGSAELNIHVNEWNEFGDYSDDYPVRW